MKYILIVSVAGTASTTLQRLIGTIPNSNITGEKQSAVEHLLESYRSIKETFEIAPKHNINGKVALLTSLQCENMRIKPCWLNTFDIEQVKCNIRNTIISILINPDNSACDVLGYKDIRWYKKTSLINEFIELFPETKVICHIHDDLEIQCKTQWLRDRPNTSRFYVKKYNNEIVQFCLSQPREQVILTKKSDIFVNVLMKRLFNWIGYEMDDKKYVAILKNALENK